MAVPQARSIGERKLKLGDDDLILQRTVEFQNYMLQSKEVAEIRA